MMGKKFVVELSETLRPFTCIFWFLFLCFCGGCVCACVCMFLNFHLLALYLCVCWEREREVLGEWGSEDDLGGVVWGEKCDQNILWKKYFSIEKGKKNLDCDQLHSISPLSKRDMFQNLHGCLKLSYISTQPYVHCFFYLYMFTIKFNLWIKHTERLAQQLMIWKWLRG